MTKQSKTTTSVNGPSKLDQFDLKYELDVDWTAARASMRKHTTK
jgi:hypothetical protein